MSAYIKLSTLEYPRHEGDIRQEHTYIRADETGDTFPCPHKDYALVVPTDMPVFNSYLQHATEAAPVNVNGVWQQVWSVRDLTADEIASITKTTTTNTIPVTLL